MNQDQIYEEQIFDREGKNAGVWNDEPDKVIWKHASGYTCHIRRVEHSGHLCGYVGIPKEHPFFDKDYTSNVQLTDEQFEEWKNSSTEGIGIMSMLSIAMAREEIEESKRVEVEALLRAHGGITFSAKIEDCDKDLWFFGFDCAHSGDYQPWSDYHDLGAYRDIEYVKDQTNKLAEQLKEWE